MSELLTAKDVELKIFKKTSFGGYAIPEVEEFLNQVAEDLEAYAMRLNEQQRKIHDLEETLKKHEAMKDTIKDALILAQKSAKDKEDEARYQAELILAKAESKVGEVDLEARKRLEAAEAQADEIVASARTSAAQIVKNAEESREEAQKRLEGVESEIKHRMEDAKERADEVLATARVDARRLSNKLKREIEDGKRELETVNAEMLSFLKDSADLISTYGNMIEEARQKLGRKSDVEKEDDTVSDIDRTDTSSKMTFSFSPSPISADEEAGDELPVPYPTPEHFSVE